MIDITFPYIDLPPSTNKAYFSRFGRRVLSSEGKKFKEATIHTFAKGIVDIRLPDTLQKIPLALKIVLEFPLFTKAGEYKRIDTDNKVKLVKDCVAEVLGIDDKNICMDIVIKIDSEEKRCLVRVYELDGTASAYQNVGLGQFQPE